MLKTIPKQQLSKSLDYLLPPEGTLNTPQLIVTFWRHVKFKVNGMLDGGRVVAGTLVWRRPGHTTRGSGMSCKPTSYCHESETVQCASPGTPFATCWYITHRKRSVNSFITTKRQYVKKAKDRLTTGLPLTYSTCALTLILPSIQSATIDFLYKILSIFSVLRLMTFSV